MILENVDQVSGSRVRIEPRIKQQLPLPPPASSTQPSPPGAQPASISFSLSHLFALFSSPHPTPYLSCAFILFFCNATSCSFHFSISSLPFPLLHSQTWQLCLRQRRLHSCWRQNDKVGSINPATGPKEFLCVGFARNNPTRHSPHPIHRRAKPQQPTTRFLLNLFSDFRLIRAAHSLC